MLREYFAQARPAAAAAATMMVVVGLASIINDRARLAEGGSQPQSAASVSSAAKSNSDPLAEAGVVLLTRSTPRSTPQSAPQSGPPST